ncbi:DNA-processing protein DprA [Aminiphilus sp.]|uniref:DNA-processing protein DprA n=1 Tax=Aminiphilus sp. TaxID=1872488 RepID=UPI002624BC0A|nr:DNA-processing protein DprA [Aminiphilus sp.]
MDDRIKALLLLNAVFAPSRVWDLLRERGLPPEALWERGCDTLHREVGLSENASEGLEKLLRRGWVEKEKFRCDDEGLRLVLCDDPDYPKGLEDLEERPLLLYVRGRFPLSEPFVAVVGTRRCTSYGRAVASALGSELARRGCVVVSGGALGIDGAAHGGTLEGGGSTVAVFGTGVDRIFPSEHEDLFRNIVATGGALMSEYPLGTPGRGWLFPRRNRIIAALSSHLVVVEAPERSGAIITARLAGEMGRELWAVPGRIDEKVCRGSNALLADGAFPLVQVAQFVDLLRPRLSSSEEGQLSLFGAEDGMPEEEDGVFSTLSADETRLLRLLRERGDRTIDNMAAEGTMSPARISAALAVLCARGLVYESGPGRWRAGPR